MRFVVMDMTTKQADEKIDITHSFMKKITDELVREGYRCHIKLTTQKYFGGFKS